MVAPQQRFKRYGQHCPICGGHAGLKQGQGERCAGYLSEDGEYVYCAREEKSGNLERNEDTTPATFRHKLYGACNCGVTHNPAKASSNGHKPQGKKAQPQSNDFFTYDDPRAVAKYPYYDEQGKLLYVAVRYEWPDKDNPKGHSKTVRQFHKEKGKWISGTQGIRRVLYRLSELLNSDTSQIVFAPEGENKVDALRQMGLVATCNPMGAKKWQKEYSDFLKGRHVVILPDNDPDGREHAQQVMASLQGIAASVRLVPLPTLPEKGDIIDWLAAGGTKEALEQLCRPPKRKFTYASEVQEQPIEWIWEGRLARGELTLAVGDAGLGKGLSTSKIIAHITCGQQLPGGSKIPPSGVILMSPEDSTSRTIVPRLRAAGADLSKVLLLTEVDDIDLSTNTYESYKRPVSFPEDAHILREAIEDAGAVAVFIDPILSMISGKVDVYKNHAVRQAMAQVMSTADKHGCAVFGIIHTTKGQHPNALFRSSSSTAFIEMARVALFFTPDPDGEADKSGVIVNHKNNLAERAASIRYAIHKTADNIGFISWEGISSRTRDELLNQDTSSTSPKSTQELDIVAVLKENGQAMTVANIAKKIQNGQTLDALEIMLRRKVDQGILMKPARGLYTYADNPLYCAKSESHKDAMSEMSEMSSVGNVGLNEGRETDIKPSYVGNGNGHKPASVAMLQETDISDMAFEEYDL